jgi:hypothetical protein
MGFDYLTHYYYNAKSVVDVLKIDLKPVLGRPGDGAGAMVFLTPETAISSLDFIRPSNTATRSGVCKP